MNKVNEIKQELERIIDDAKKIVSVFTRIETDSKQWGVFVAKYDLWYSKALNIVKNILPDRLGDFTVLYRDDKRKKITQANYTISDALKGIVINRISYIMAYPALLQQVAIVNACLEKFDSKIYDIQSILQADIFDSELDSARHLLRKGFLRASGAVCGVVLEKHLSKVCDNHGIIIKKKEPTISIYNDELKNGDVYDTMEWRRMQRLGDLRNLCDHDKKREPTKEEVDELISGVERVIKTIF